MSEDREAIAAAYYRDQEAKLDALVVELVREALRQGVELDDLIGKVEDTYT